MAHSKMKAFLDRRYITLNLQVLFCGVYRLEVCHKKWIIKLVINDTKGLGTISVLLIITVLCVTSLAGWRVHEYVSTRSASTPDIPTSEVSITHPHILSNNESGLEPETIIKDLDNNPLSGDVPSTPKNLNVVPSGGGYLLNWDASTSTNPIVKYQVFYQGKLLSEPTHTNYQHDLPPVPPGCSPITLDYFVKAVDSSGLTSAPSSSVTIQTGGC